MMAMMADGCGDCEKSSNEHGKGCGGGVGSDGVNIGSVGSEGSGSTNNVSG